MTLKKTFALLLMFAAALNLAAADIYVSISSGKNKNAGTKDAPLKNLWKAIEKAAAGDTIHVAEGNYSGKMSCGWIEVNKPVTILGGYAADFSKRDFLTHHTTMRPSNKQNATKPVFGTMTIKTRSAGAQSQVKVDGFIFDHTDANSYHPANGKPEGFAQGMYLIPPTKGNTQFPSIDRYQLHADTDGELTISNCLFLNSSNYAVNVNHFSGKVNIINNCFIGSRMMACEVRSTNAKPLLTEFNFTNNTVLFTWTRTKEFEDMGYGVRSNEGIISNINSNILGLNCMAGYDNTKGNSAKKQISLDNNIFFLNKKADVATTVSPNILFMKVEDDGFEDLADTDGMESMEDNQSLSDPAIFKDIIDTNYLQAFLSATYTETVNYDENSPVNQFRAALGLNKQGTINSKVSMFCNPYPFESAIKFFGAVNDFGAQK